MNNVRRNQGLLAGIGAAIEYYDYIIFILLTPYIGEIFFKDSCSLKAFMLWFVASLARLIGGGLFGLCADRYGRKATLVAINLIMCVATFSMGLLPTSWVMILVILRCLQGLSYGAEVPGACAFAYEHRTSTAIVVSASAVGYIFASLLFTIISFVFSQSEITSYAWRIPFLVGGILCIVLVWMRKQMIETTKTTLHYTYEFGAFARATIQSVCILCFPMVMLVSCVYLQSIAKLSYGANMQNIFSANTISIIWSAIISMAIYKKRIDYVALLSFMIKSFIPVGIIIGLTIHMCTMFVYDIVLFCIMQVYVTIPMICGLGVVSSLFPANKRGLGFGIAYNTAFLIASCVPVIHRIISIESSLIAIWGLSCGLSLYGLRKILIHPAVDMNNLASNVR